jgi:hypothetical protein
MGVIHPRVHDGDHDLGGPGHHAPGLGSADLREVPLRRAVVRIVGREGDADRAIDLGGFDVGTLAEPRRQGLRVLPRRHRDPPPAEGRPGPPRWGSRPRPGPPGRRPAGRSLYASPERRGRGRPEPFAHPPQAAGRNRPGSVGEDNGHPPAGGNTPARRRRRMRPAMVSRPAALPGPRPAPGRAVWNRRIVHLPPLVSCAIFRPHVDMCNFRSEADSPNRPHRVCPKIVGQLRAVVLQRGEARQNWDTPAASARGSKEGLWDKMGFGVRGGCSGIRRTSDLRSSAIPQRAEHATRARQAGSPREAG